MTLVGSVLFSTSCWAHIVPNSLASKVPLQQLFILQATGAFQRRSSSGASAYGIPLNTTASFSNIPRTEPLLSSTMLL